MNKNITMLFTFVAGVAVGALATYKIAEQKYSNIANDEIESVIEQFSNRRPMLNQESSVERTVNKAAEKQVNTSKAVVSEYRETINRFNYDTVSKVKSKPKKGNDKNDEVEGMEEVKAFNATIYVISPDAFNTLDGFTTETLYYSSDNYLLDSDYQVLSDDEIKQKIDHDPNGHFGEYEDDSVYIRNEDLMCDFEILLSMKTCEEIMED